MQKLFVIIIIALIFIGGSWYLIMYTPAESPSSDVHPIATVSYQCNGGKTIQARFFQGDTKPAAGPDQPPIPGGSAKVVLSDGRTMMLKQTISADGVRYSNGDLNVQGSETFVFWTKGNGVLVLENDVEKNYTGCTEVNPSA